MIKYFKFTIALSLLFVTNGLVAQNTSSQIKECRLPIFDSAALAKSLDEEIFGIVEVMPSYPGGQEEFEKFIKKELKYPRRAFDKEVDGEVTVRFLVNRDGSTSGERKIVKGVGYGLDEEAIRLLGLIPQWIPGQMIGINRNVIHTVTITFRHPNKFRKPPRRTGN